MKIFSFLLIFLFSSNLFAQINWCYVTADSTSAPAENDSGIVNKNPVFSKPPKKTKEVSSDEKQGILIGAVIGAAAGVGIGALLSNFSLEPHSHREYPIQTAIVCGVVGALVGGIIGGLVSK
jgi:hypothetical protein